MSEGVNDYGLQLYRYLKHEWENEDLPPFEMQPMTQEELDWFEENYESWEVTGYETND